jgi:hypothetical protein
MMIDAHPRVSIPPETGFLPEIIRGVRGSELSPESLFTMIREFETWNDFHISEEALAEEVRGTIPFSAADGVRAFYRLYARRFNKPLWGDKTPNYGLHLEEIGRLLPEARFIHIIRDGRDVAASIRDLWFAPSKDFADLARDWEWRVRTIRAQGESYPFYLEIRYEHLLSDTEENLREICSFLEIPFHPRMTTYYLLSPLRLQEHEARYRPDGTLVIGKEERLSMQRLATQPPVLSRIGAWRSSMSEQEHRRFLQLAPLLFELGYSQTR